MSNFDLEKLSDLDSRLHINSDGNIRVIYGKDVIDRSIRNILSTRKGERVRRPEYGSDLYRYLWNPITEDSLLMIENDVKQSLERFEDRIDIRDVRVRGDPDKNLIEIDVNYTIRSSRRSGQFNARVKTMVDS